MFRRHLIRRSLIAALALVMAAAPSVAQAGNLYGTKQTAPLQFKNYSNCILFDVTLTHHFGVYNETFYIGTVDVGEVVRGPFQYANSYGIMSTASAVTFYTNGTIPASDYWTITAQYHTDNNYDEYLNTTWRSLQPFDLHAADAGVYFTVLMAEGGDTTGTGTDMKLNFYSNSTCKLDMPMFVE